MKLTILLISLLFTSGNVLASQIELMTYNVENLFDTFHDEGKNDFYFLPKDSQAFKDYCSKEDPNDSYQKRTCKRPVDWTLEKYQLKLSKIKEVFDFRKQNSESNAYPDIVALVEVENARVVGDLAKLMGYDKFIVTEGNDSRGIDVALMWRESDQLTLKSSRTHFLKHLSSYLEEVR